MFIYLFIILFSIGIIYHHYILSLFIDTLASFISFIFSNIENSRKKIVLYNISLVFPNFNNEKKKQILFQSTKISIINVLSGLFGRCLYRTNYHKNITINIPDKCLHDIDNVGILLVSSHYSMIYTGTNYIGYSANRKTNTVYKKQKYINYFLYPSNTYSNTNFIPFIPALTKEKLIKIKGGIVILACDQKAYNDKPKIKFLNQLVKFHYGPALLHLKTGRKIWYADITYNLKTMKQQAYFVDISSQLIKNSTDTDITQKIADTMSERIMLHPEQYLWFYNRFSKNQYN